MRLTSKSPLILLTLSVSSIALSNPAFADAKDDRIAAMEAQMQIMMREIQALKAERAGEKQQQAALQKQVQNLQNTTAKQIAAIAPAAGNASNNGVKITMNPSPKFESADGKYSFQPFGRVHLDATAFQDDKKDHASGADLRRARLGFKGKLGEDFSYKTQVDFADEEVGLKEVSLTYSGLDVADITVGHTKPKVGLQQNTSANYIQFIERSAPTNTFTRDEELGINVKGGGDNWSLAAGLFNEDAGNDNTGDDEDMNLDVRGSLNVLGLMPNTETDNVLHLGAGMSHRRPTGAVSFGAKPTGEGDNMVSTGSFSAVDDVNVYVAEAAGIFGPVSVQGEYFNAQVQRNGGNADANFDGYYAQASWLLTGEQRPYSGKKGNFGRIKPQNPFSLKEGGWGAWEILARHENVDLNDASAGIMGGELDSVTAGVNWYLNNHMRIMSNVVVIDTDSNAVVADDDPTVYNTRLQWDF